jgi:hypothetical protein
MLNILLVLIRINKPSTCLIWMWTPLGFNSQSQPLHIDMVGAWWAPRISADFPKSRPTNGKIVACDDGSTCLSTSYEWWQTPYILNIWQDGANHFVLVWGLSHNIRALFLSGRHHTPFQLTVQNLAQQMWQKQCHDGSTCPSTSYKWSWWQTPYKCQARMWQPLCVGLRPQSQHEGMVSVRWTHSQDFSWLSKI